MTAAARLSQRILPNSINVGCSAETVERGRRDVVRAGGTEFTLDITGIATTTELSTAWHDVFAVPWPIWGIDAIISVGSDLGWIPGTRNFWIDVTGVDGVPPAVLQGLCAAIADIIDRMRSGGCNYTVAFPPSPRTAELLTLLDAENRHLGLLEGGRQTNDTHPVTVVDHRGAAPRIVGRTHHFDAFPLLANAFHLHCGRDLIRETRLPLDPDRDRLQLLDLTGVDSSANLLARCGACFSSVAPPTELSDLVPAESDRDDWAWRRFAITLVTNADGVPSPVLRQLVWLLAGRIDRVRAVGGDRETVMMPPSPRAGEIAALLASENRELEAMGRATGGDIYPIPVIDHRDDRCSVTADRSDRG